VGAAAGAFRRVLTDGARSPIGVALACSPTPKPFCDETFGVEDLIMGSWQDETRNSGGETCCTAITQ
jgi:hypothetical protein